MGLFTILSLKINFNMKSCIWGVLIAILLFLACSGESSNMREWKELDLMQHGIPFSILAPDSSKVETSDFSNILKDVTIKKGDDFFVQIFASDANTTDISKIKQEQLSEVKDMRYFNKLVEESDRGFIYESKKDSSNTYYGFRYIRLQGTKEYILQNGFLGFFTEDQARSMYKAVSTESKK